MATTSLGRLTLDLLVRLGSFEQGLNRAERQASQSASNMSDAFRGFGDQIRESLGGTQIGSIISDVTTRLEGMQGSVLTATAGLAGLAVGGTALAIGGLAVMSIEAAKADNEMAMLAARAKIGIENFQIFTYAAEQLGISQDQLGSIFADVQEKLGEFSATGGGGAADFFDALKNNTKLTDDQIKAFSKTLQGKDGVEAVQMLKDKLDDLGASSQEQRFVFESLASDLTNLMPLFSESGAKIEEYGKALQDAGVIKSKEAIQQSQILAAQTQAVNLQFQGAKSQLVQGFMPAIVSVSDAMFGTSKNGVQLATVGDGLGTVFKILATLALGTSHVIQQVGNAFGAVAAMAVAAAKRDFASVVAIYEDSEKRVDDINSDMLDRYSKVWGPVTESSNTLVNALQSISNATTDSSTGLKVNTKEAEENAKANDARAKAITKNAKAQDDLNRMVGASALSGLRIKGAESIAGGGVKAYTAEFAKMTQELLGSQLVRFTSFNDKYHQGKGGKHPIGQAFDFTVKDAAEANESIQRIQAMAKKYGFAVKTLNEYSDPSKNATGGHIHVSVLGYKGSADALKEANAELDIVRMANDEASRLHDEREKDQLAIVSKYATEEQKMALDNQEAIKAIKLAYAEGDPSRQKYLDLQQGIYDRDVAAFEKSLQEKREAAWEKINELHRDAAMASQNWNSTAAEMMGSGAIYQLDQQRNARYAESTAVFETQTDILNQQELEPGADLEALAAQKEAIWQAHNDRMAAIDADYHSKSLDLNMSYGADILGSMSSIAKNVAGENSSFYAAMFAMEKGMAVARSMMAIQVALAQASANPFPMNLAAMATVAMQTANIVATIQGVQAPTGMAHNGIDNIPKEGTWLLDGGERVLNPEQNKDLTNYLSDRQAANTQNQPMESPQVNVRVMNSWDDSEYYNALAAPQGEKIVMNIIKRNRTKLRI